MEGEGMDCTGWDVGGAHLKAARAEAGRIVGAVQQPCPLWLGRDRLGEAMATVRLQLGETPLHAVTMTGELADIFASRAEGVAWIAATMATALAPSAVRIYDGAGGFVPPGSAALHAEAIASANWHASATLTARSIPNALFSDMGSTTTDLVPIRGGAVAARGHSDAERLAVGELVYTGLTRSFVMALAPSAPLDGVWTPLAHEYFASTADVYRVLGELSESADQMPTADGREKTVAGSSTRLARMVGRDAASATAATWEGLAAWFAEAQLRQIADAAMLVLSVAALPPDAPVIGAGVGQHVLARLAGRLGRRFVRFADLPGLGGAADEWVGHCAPAVAMALLA